MPATQIISDVFISMNRSLLQYVGENSPWTAANDQDVQEQLQAIVCQQRKQISRVADFLNLRLDFIDAGRYPTEYTDMQYLSLNYLLDKLIEDQAGVLREIHAGTKVCGTDASARDLLSQLEVAVATTLGSLKELAEKRKTPSTIK